MLELLSGHSVDPALIRASTWLFRLKAGHTKFTARYDRIYLNLSCSTPSSPDGGFSSFQISTLSSGREGAGRRFRRQVGSVGETSFGYPSPKGNLIMPNVERTR